MTTLKDGFHIISRENQICIVFDKYDQRLHLLREELEAISSKGDIPFDWSLKEVGYLKPTELEMAQMIFPLALSEAYLEEAYRHAERDGIAAYNIGFGKEEWF